MAEPDERLDALEERIAYQDATLEELSDLAGRQWKEIDLLKAEIARLRGRLEELEEAARKPPGEEEPPPPHY